MNLVTSNSSLAYKDRTAQQAGYPVDIFHVHSQCKGCGITILQADYDAFQQARKRARRVSGQPHLFSWDIIASLSIQEDVLAHLLEPFCSFLCGSAVGSDRPESWDKIPHRQRINAVKREIGRVRTKRFHKVREGQRSLDRLVFEVRRSGGRVSIAYATAYLGFKTTNGHGVRKLVKRSNGLLAVLDGFVVLSVSTSTKAIHHHVTMQLGHGSFEPHTKSVIPDGRLKTRRRPSHTNYWKPQVTIQTDEPKAPCTELWVGGRRKPVATTDELMELLWSTMTDKERQLSKKEAAWNRIVRLYIPRYRRSDD